MKVFKDYAYYYNLFYENKNYQEEALQIDDILKKYGRNISTIINFGCGTGKHDIEFSRLGYQCTGIDMSPLMIDIAKENSEKENINIDFYVEDIRDFNLQRQYDAVLSLFHVISYQNTNQDVIKAFQMARKVLNSGGIFLFDVWYGPGVLSDKPVVRIKEIENNGKRLVRIAKPVMHDKENVVEVNYEVFVLDKQSGKVETIDEIHNMRYFFRPEVECFLENTGFRLIENLDCKTLKETNYGSWTSYFIAEAI